MNVQNFNNNNNNQNNNNRQNNFKVSNTLYNIYFLLQDNIMNTGLVNLDNLFEDPKSKSGNNNRNNSNNFF